MKLRQALIGFGIVSLIYFAALAFLGARKEEFSSLSNLWAALPLLSFASLLSWVIRFARWHWLLVRAGHRTKIFGSFVVYLSGFAFAATPGKVGELIRIRYLSPMGIPAWRTLSAFVFERAFDLLAVLGLAAFFISRLDIFIFATVFVFLFLAFIILIASRPSLLIRLDIYVCAWHAMRLSRWINTLREGLAGCRVWVNPLDIAVAWLLGLVAWGVTALSFVYLLGHLEINLPFLPAVSVYPLAMLAGAASLLPGGLGSTEATIIAILSFYGFSVGVGTLAAIGIRVATLWLSILCGVVAVAVLEMKIFIQQSEKMRNST